MVKFLLEPQRQFSTLRTFSLSSSLWNFDLALHQEKFPFKPQEILETEKVDLEMETRIEE